MAVADTSCLDATRRSVKLTKAAAKSKAWPQVIRRRKTVCFTVAPSEIAMQIYVNRILRSTLAIVFYS